MRFFRSVGVLLVIILAFTAFSAFDCGDGKAILTISISPTTDVILTYDPPNSTSQTFTAFVTWDNDTSGDGTDDVDWVSEDENVAAFTDNVLHPVAVGATRVRATGENGTIFSTWRNVTVRPPFAVLDATASASDDTIDINDSITLTMMASIDEDDDDVEDSTENVTSITTWVVDAASTGAGTINGNQFTATDDGNVIINGTFDDGDVTLSTTFGDSVTITVLPPVSVVLSASTTTPGFTGTANTTINLTAVPSGGTPDGYDWTTTAGTLGSATTTGPTNTLDINWQNAGATITIGVTADFQGVDAMDDAQVTVAAAQGPSFTDLTVNGGTVGDGLSAGDFSAGESLAVVASASDPDGGTVSYAWSATNGATVNPTTGASVSVSQNAADTVSTVTCTITDNNGGASAQRTFTFNSTMVALVENEMRLRQVGHIEDGSPEDPDPDQVRILFEVGPMNPGYYGVTVQINYDSGKVSADGTGAKHPENVFGNDGLNIFRPDLQPADMTYSGLSATTDSGPVFFIDWDVISGSGTATDFTFNTDGNNSTFVDGSLVNHDAALYTPATGIMLP